MSAPKKTTAEERLVASSVDAWGSDVEPREHKLPSGNVMVLRRAPSLRRLIREGVIPNAMLGVVMIPIEAEVEDEDGTKGIKTIPAYEHNFKRFEEQSAAIVCAMAVDPPVVMKPLAGALLYDLLDDVDVTYIVEWAKGGVDGVARFLEQLRGDSDGAGGEVLGEDPE